MQWSYLFLGLIWGAAVSVSYYGLMQWDVKRSSDLPEQCVRKVINWQIVKYFINLMSMFVVYKNLWMLVGTGFGLTAMKNILVVRELCHYRKPRCKASADEKQGSSFNDWDDEEF